MVDQRGDALVARSPEEDPCSDVSCLLVVGAALRLWLPSGRAPNRSVTSPGAAPDDRPDPIPITTDVVLTHDLTCDLLMWVLAPGVTVDLIPHRVTVNQPFACARSFFDFCNISVGPGATLRNGRIDGATVGVKAGASSTSTSRWLLLGLVNNCSAPTPRPKSVIRYSVVDGGGVTMEGGRVVASSWVINGDGINLHNTEQGVAGFAVTDSFLLYNRGASTTAAT